VLGTRQYNFQPPIPTLIAKIHIVTDRQTDRQTDDSIMPIAIILHAVVESAKNDRHIYRIIHSFNERLKTASQ